MVVSRPAGSGQTPRKEAEVELVDSESELALTATVDTLVLAHTGVAEAVSTCARRAHWPLQV